MPWKWIEMAFPVGTVPTIAVEEKSAAYRHWLDCAESNEERAYMRRASRLVLLEGERPKRVVRMLQPEAVVIRKQTMDVLRIPHELREDILGLILPVHHEVYLADRGDKHEPTERESEGGDRGPQGGQSPLW